MLSPGVESY
ncbi:Protein of unknown function [Bacillus wiedmannii]|uniref:Uncharacterized protein n=1 Tax=Bacillus wiedmannii TaxID=1890302 RepID=A0A1C4E9P8_9BACI|nr:Protein of unknown function [Bacillus wiedmannii]SCM00960.1 Protein of unknown function [Bacillus wiedmannii]